FHDCVRKNRPQKLGGLPFQPFSSSNALVLGLVICAHKPVPVCLLHPSSRPLEGGPRESEGCGRVTARCQEYDVAILTNTTLNATCKPGLHGPDPYRIAAGPELDGAIHRWLFGESSTTPVLGYSTDDVLAKQVEHRLKKRSAADVLTGTTRMHDKCYFARYERDPSTGAEVLAETYALAICRLALLWSHGRGMES
ncbi:MAG: hypothetical protein ACYDH9_24860, partial [Limisphaerales bacterium]